MSELVGVLVIDDREHIAEMTSRMLEEATSDIITRTETRADDALATFDEGSIDAIVSDYDMPGMDGLELLEEVRDRDPDIPFILYTGRGSEDVASDAISAGVTDYLQKEDSLGNYDLLATRVISTVEQAETRRELRRARARFQALSENTPYGIITIDENSTIQYANETVEEILGHEHTELAGNSLTTLIPQRLRASHREALSEYIETGEKSLDWSSIYLHGLSADGEEIPLEIMFGEYDKDNDALFTGIIRERDETTT